MFLLEMVLMCFGWSCVIIFGVLCVMLAVKMVCERSDPSSTDSVRVGLVDMANITAIEKENAAIDAIYDFCNAESEYCDNQLSDREKLQDLYDEFLVASKARKDGNYAVQRNLLSYRLDNPSARKVLIENLLKYLTLRKEKNNYVLYRRNAQAICK